MDEYDSGEEPVLGDIVTRTGSDHWIVKHIDPEFGQLTCLCLLGASWCQPGETESLIPNRYRLIKRAPQEAASVGQEVP